MRFFCQHKYKDGKPCTEYTSNNNLYCRYHLIVRSFLGYNTKLFESLSEGAISSILISLVLACICIIQFSFTCNLPMLVIAGILMSYLMINLSLYVIYTDRYFRRLPPKTTTLTFLISGASFSLGLLSIAVIGTIFPQIINILVSSLPLSSFIFPSVNMSSLVYILIIAAIGLTGGDYLLSYLSIASIKYSPIKVQISLHFLSLAFFIVLFIADFNPILLILSILIFLSNIESRFKIFDKLRKMKF